MEKNEGIFTGATEDYIGDGVYTEWDGFGILLKANHHKHPTDKVYLEPAVFVSLLNFASKFLKFEYKIN